MAGGGLKPPREPWSGSYITGPQITAALAGLRMEQMMSIHWDLRPSVGIIARDVRRLGMDIRSFREPMTIAIKEVIIPSIKRNFVYEGRPAWTPLKETTAQRRHGEFHPILHRSGTLERRATQLSIWDIGRVTATIRRLPSDAYYGVFHQAGVASNQGGWQELSKHAPHSSAAEAIIGRFIPKAAAELGAGATASHVRNRAIGMLIDSDTTYSLPQRMFVMYQPEDIIAIQKVFEVWMTERAILVGRFRPS